MATAGLSCAGIVIVAAVLSFWSISAASRWSTSVRHMGEQTCCGTMQNCPLEAVAAEGFQRTAVKLWSI
jgi:hypothetical protein